MPEAFQNVKKRNTTTKVIKGEILSPSCGALINYLILFVERHELLPVV